MRPSHYLRGAAEEAATEKILATILSDVELTVEQAATLVGTGRNAARRILYELAEQGKVERSSKIVGIRTITAVFRRPRARRKLGPQNWASPILTGGQQ